MSPISPISRIHGISPIQAEFLDDISRIKRRPYSLNRKIIHKKTFPSHLGAHQDGAPFIDNENDFEENKQLLKDPSPLLVRSFEDMLPEFHQLIADFYPKIENTSLSVKKELLKGQLKKAIHKVAALPVLYQVSLHLIYEVEGMPCYFNELDPSIDESMLRFLYETISEDAIPSPKAYRILQELLKIYEDYQEDLTTDYTGSLTFTIDLLTKINALISEFAPQKDTQNGIWLDLHIIQSGLNMAIDCFHPENRSRYTTMPLQDKIQLQFVQTMVASSIMKPYKIHVSQLPSHPIAFAIPAYRRINICRPSEKMHQDGLKVTFSQFSNIPSVMVHELLHYVEMNLWVLESIKSYLNQHSTDYFSPNDGYVENAFDGQQAVDGILNLGNVYKKNSQITFTEFFPVIGEKFYKDPADLIQKAPDLARIFINLLRGIAI